MLKAQVFYKALQEDLSLTDFEESMIHQNKRPRIEKLVLHTNETIMRRKKFQVMVGENGGKMIDVTYDKRKILNPDVEYDEISVIDTLPWGHDEIHEYLHKFRNA